MDDYFPLPLQSRPEREHLYKWISEEEVYVAEKFDEQHGSHDDSLRRYEFEEFWMRQIVQYLDRARHFLDAAKHYKNTDERRALEMRAQQAIAKAMMTAKGCAEASIRVFGSMPKPGVPSGEIEEWE